MKFKLSKCNNYSNMNQNIIYLYLAGQAWVLQFFVAAVGFTEWSQKSLSTNFKLLSIQFEKDVLVPGKINNKSYLASNATNIGKLFLKPTD